MSAAVDGSKLKDQVQELTRTLDHCQQTIARVDAMLVGLVDQVRAELDPIRTELAPLGAGVAYAAERGDQLQRDLYHVSARVDAVWDSGAGAQAALNALAGRIEQAFGGLGASSGESSAGLWASLEGLSTSTESAAALLLSRLDDMAEDAREAERQREGALRSISATAERAEKRSEALLAVGDGLREALSVPMTRADLLAQRIVIPLGAEVLLGLRDGFVIAPAEESALIAAVWETRGRLEPGTLAVVSAILREGDRFVDVGANIGLLTIPAGRAVGATGHVVAVEPASRVADALDRSAFLNFGHGRVTVHRCAAGDRDGTAPLHIGATSTQSSLLPIPGATRSEDVAVERLDALVPAGAPVRLVKLDVEGSELDAMRGMSRIMDENPELAIIVEYSSVHLQRSGIAVDDWMREVVPSGFAAYEIDEMKGILRPMRACEMLHGMTSQNLLLLRQPASSYPNLKFA